MLNRRTQSTRMGLFLAATLACTPVLAGDIPWLTDYAQAAQQSAESGRPILVEVTAPWCGYCQLKHQQTFTDQQIVRQLTTQFVPLEVNADDQPDLVEQFRVESLPTTLIVSPDLKIVRRITGFQAATEFGQMLGQIAQAYPSRQTTMQELTVASAEKPVNVSRFGFGDYCLVTMLEENKLKKGAADFVATYKGIEVCFTSAEHKQRFLAHPEKYWPVANGQCLVSDRDENARQTGKPHTAVTWNGRLWFFVDQSHRQRFMASPHRYHPGLM